MMLMQRLSEKCMKEPLLTFPQSKRRDTGRDTSIFGSTMHYMKSWRQRQVGRTRIFFIFFFFLKYFSYTKQLQVPVES